jgi:hypothetical protein
LSSGPGRPPCAEPNRLSMIVETGSEIRSTSKRREAPGDVGPGASYESNDARLVVEFAGISAWRRPWHAAGKRDDMSQLAWTFSSTRAENNRQGLRKVNGCGHSCFQERSVRVHHRILRNYKWPLYRARGRPLHRTMRRNVYGTLLIRSRSSRGHQVLNNSDPSSS